MDIHVPVIFYKKLFILLFSGFIVATIAGTLSHECGHYLAGRLLGYKGQHISYAFTSMGYKHGYSPAGIDNWQHDELLFIMGGPLETITVGTLGFLLLCLYSPRAINQEGLQFWRWLLIFLSLFWLRELFNCVCAAAVAILGTYNYSGDEFRIAEQLHWNSWLCSAVLACIALAILLIITFRFIPQRQWFTFLTAGLTGGITGAVLWLVLLGPKIMPIN